MSAGSVTLTASIFNQLGHYVINISNKAHCYTEVTISSPAGAITTISTHYASH